MGIGSDFFSRKNLSVISCRLRRVAGGNACHRHKPLTDETMYDVVNSFDTKLRQAFDAEESTISVPNPERNYWLVNVPIQGRFDNSESKVCISFHVTQDQCNDRDSDNSTCHHPILL